MKKTDIIMVIYFIVVLAFSIVAAWNAPIGW
jgi:hypothetical protein